MRELMKKRCKAGLVMLSAVLSAGLAGAEVARNFRPPAVPLVNVDPHFSLWSAADRLYDADTTFWTGARQPLRIWLDADGVTYRLCGRGDWRNLEQPVLPQRGLTVGATTTRYAFAGRNGLSAEVAFLTPRLTEDLDAFSRPVAYVTVKVRGAKSWKVRAKIDAAFATNDDCAEMTWTTNAVAGLPAVRVGRRQQTPFSDCGDGRRPDWGFAWLVGPATDGDAAHFLLAYDDVKGVRFMGRDLADWWRRDGKPFETMLAEAERDYAGLVRRTADFDATFAHDMETVGGRKYADIAALAWRQSFGACRFVANSDGEPSLFSNENGSGGMIGTTDVFYPQLPHLLLSSLTLVRATLAPTCIYAASTNWPYAYAPHDLGLFPAANGQFYGMRKGQSVGGGDDHTFRMPVEECGNMLICLAALAQAEGNADFAGRWWGEVSQWTEYLKLVGFDPENQLCTDDFAGHLAHNANLSIKSIVALRAYAMLAGMRGESKVAAQYEALAKSSVTKWLEVAKGGLGGGYRIAFDRPGTWSQKYNLVWDRLLGFNLFPAEVARAELAVYRQTAHPFGVPLDCRRTYAKADWSIWSGTLTGKKEDLAFMAEGVHAFLQATPDRIPFSDWYMADSGLFRGFMARSVVGGVMIPVLQYPELVRRYRTP